MENLITLNNLNQAKELIAQANISQLKEIISRAEALKVYAAQAKKGLEIQNQVAEIKLRAEKKIGEMLKTMPKNKGSQGKGVQLHDATTPTLKELEIDKSQSHRWQQIASLSETDFEKEIQIVKTLNKELTSAGMLRFASLKSQEMNKKNLKITPLPQGEFDVLLADPPWKYDFSPTIAINIENHYPTMELQEICDLKIPSAKNAVLFLWTTNPKLKEALQVIDSWGFNYKTNICWDKQKPTSSKMGYWFLGQHELLLVGTKGQFSPPASENRMPSLYSELKTKHSKKPDYFYKLIEQMFPYGKYLELFARQKYADNWTVWGTKTT